MYSYAPLLQLISTFNLFDSNSKPKIADYPFTTIVPNLGVCDLFLTEQMNGEVSSSLVLADIPGLLEGAHEGVGLGIAFLRHVQRCRLVFFSELVYEMSVQLTEMIERCNENNHKHKSDSSNLNLSKGVILLRSAILFEHSIIFEFSFYSYELLWHRFFHSL